MRHVSRTALLILCLASAGASRAEDEADRLCIARELIVVNQTIQQVDSILPTFMNALKPAITHNDPKIEKDYDAILALMYQEFQPFKAQFGDDFARLQASAFTKAELEEISGFSKSATGQKMIAMGPKLAQAGMALGQQYGQKVGNQLTEKIKAELRKPGHNI
jgi:uncharacterized protein